MTTKLSVDVSGDTTAADVAEGFAAAVTANANFTAVQMAGTNVIVVTNAASAASSPPAVRISGSDFPTNANAPASASISSAVASNNEMLLTAAAQRYASALLRSHRVLVYRPGQGSLSRFTAKFVTAVAGLDQFAGIGNLTGGFFFVVDYLTGEFGIDRRYGGKPEIRTLTVTTGAGAAGVVVVTLDGVATEVAITHTGGNTALTAAEIASADYSHVEFEACNDGSTVIFMSTRVRPTLSAPLPRPKPA